MSHKVCQHPFPPIGRTVLKVPYYTRFLSVVLDKRFSTARLYTLEDGEQERTERVLIVVVPVHGALEPVNAKYVGQFEDNSGIHQVFALRESEKLSMQVIAEFAEEKK